MPVSPNLLVTESRDLDTWLVRSPALERVLAEYGDKHAIDTFEQVHGSVRDNLVRLALPFGQLRWLSAREAIGINFKPLSPHQFVEPNWDFKVDRLFAEAANQVHRDVTDLRTRVDMLPVVDPWLICQGHDLLAILAKGLFKGGALGSRNPKAEIIASTLRASLDKADWFASQMVADIRQWETNNVPFRVL